MRTKFLLFLTLFTVLISCSDNHFRQFDDLPEDQRWYASDKKTYEFKIDDNSKPYNLIFHFSHVYDYQFSSIPLVVTIESPSGKKEELKIALNIKEESGKQLADCSGDVCDLFYKIIENAKLEKGSYKITISHSFDGPYLPNVIGVGLAVENVK